jgi:hypothetical protein
MKSKLVRDPNQGLRDEGWGMHALLTYSCSTGDGQGLQGSRAGPGRWGCNQCGCAGQWAVGRRAAEEGATERRAEAGGGDGPMVGYNRAAGGWRRGHDWKREEAANIWSTHLPYSCAGQMLDGPKLKTCSWATWATTRATALVALVLGPPMHPPTHMPTFLIVNQSAEKTRSKQLPQPNPLQYIASNMPIKHQAS